MATLKKRCPPERRWRVVAAWLGLAGLCAPVRVWAQDGAGVAPAGVAPGLGAPPGRLVDRVIARFTAPETGGIGNPRFIFERELAFEARLEALADGGFSVSAATPYLERHVRAALERHMSETLLQSLEITPPPSAKDLDQRQRFARLAILEQVGGQGVLEQMLESEGIEPSELDLLLARRARASLYLDRMVATMLTPTDTELRIVHRTTRTPFSAQPYEAIAPLLGRWYVAQRLNAAVRAFYEGARSRIKVTLAAPLPRAAPASEAPAPP